MLARKTALKAAHISAWCVLITSVVLQFLLATLALTDRVETAPAVVVMALVALAGWAASVMADATQDWEDEA